MNTQARNQNTTRFLEGQFSSTKESDGTQDHRVKRCAMQTVFIAIGAVGLVLAAGWTPSAHAWPACLTMFSAKYPASTTDDAAACQTCHVNAGGGSNWNVYGQHLLANGALNIGASCNTGFDAALAAVEGLDSDQEGNTNFTEIDANAQPGWCEVTNSGCDNLGFTPPAGILLDPPSGNQPPVADPNGPYSAFVGEQITFDGSGSNDPDGSITAYDWDFGDGSTGIGVNPSHSYAAAGTFTVMLAVTDDGALTDTAATTATITEVGTNQPPTADPNGPYSGQPNIAVQFDGSASSDPNGDPLTYDWDFGDGATGTGVAPTHAYAMDGDYAVVLVVNDGAADSVPATTTASIQQAADEGQALYTASCFACHGDPWSEPAIDPSLAGLKRVTGAKTCSIEGAIFGTSIFPGGVPPMVQFGLQDLELAQIEAIADYLNTDDATGEQRYVTACSGCHGNDGSGGPVDEDVRGESAEDVAEAIYDEDEMFFLACLPESDIDSIGNYLMALEEDDDDCDDDDGGDCDDDFDDDGIDDDADSDDDNDGMPDDYEDAHNFDPRDPSDANEDADGDGISNLSEFLAGSNPRDAGPSGGSGSYGFLSLICLAMLGRRRRVALRCGIADGGSNSFRRIERV